MNVKPAVPADGDVEYERARRMSLQPSSNGSAGHRQPGGTLRILHLSHKNARYLGLNPSLLLSSVSH